MWCGRRGVSAHARGRGRDLAGANGRQRHAGELHVARPWSPRCAAGGVITFDCGPEPVTIRMTRDRQGPQRQRPDVVIDGGGKVTLSGGGKRRILYMNTCDQAQVWTTPHCQDQATPRLAVQNITFVDGNSTGERSTAAAAAPSSSAAAGSRSSTRASSATAAIAQGPDIGGAAVRVLSQYQGLPVYVVNSTFGGGRQRAAATAAR